MDNIPIVTAIHQSFIPGIENQQKSNSINNCQIIGNNGNNEDNDGNSGLQYDYADNTWIYL